MSALDDYVWLLEARGVARAYPLGGVPASPGYPYMVVSADTGTPGIRRAGGGATKKARRVVVQIFGTTDDAVLDYASLADLTFEDRVLDIEGRPFSLREMQTEIRRDPDANGVLYLLHTYKLLEA